MALAVLLRNSCRLPALGNAASKILATQSLKSSLVLTPIAARNFTALNKPTTLGNHGLVSNQIIQTRNMNHAQIWAMEKILSVALLGIIPVCFMFPSPMMNNLLALSVVVHMHWGVEAILCDYLRYGLVGNVGSRIAIMVVWLISAITLAGLLLFNYKDVGMVQGFRLLWDEIGLEPGQGTHVHKNETACCRRYVKET